MSWYRRYRPQTVAGLQATSMRHALEKIRLSGSFSHAYLLTGPKGTGKTTSARILARMLNCLQNRPAVEAFLHQKKAQKLQEPCGKCPTCVSIAEGTSLCVTEIDAASHNSVDDIRSLQESLGLIGGDGLIRVCIFDEVHMLSAAAFNAFLKVLEEPPAHVVFVLATTELRKLPETIISRCQILQSQKATIEEVVAALQGILTQEGIQAELAALQEIAKQADGSFRDAVKLLEQFCQDKTELKLADILDSGLGQAKNLAEKVLGCLQQRDAQTLGKVFQEAEQYAIDLVIVQKLCLGELHDQLLANPTDSQTSQLLRQLNQPINPFLPISALAFELACLDWCLAGTEGKKSPTDSVPPSTSNTPSDTPLDTSTSRSTLKKTGPVKSVAISADALANKPTAVDSIAVSAEVVEVASVSRPQLGSVGDSADDVSETVMELVDVPSTVARWLDVRAKVKQVNSSLESLLRQAKPVVGEKHVLTIQVAYPFHKDRLEEEKHRRLLESAIKEVCGLERLRLAFVVGATPVVTHKVVGADLVSAQQAADLVSAVQEVM